MVLWMMRLGGQPHQKRLRAVGGSKPRATTSQNKVKSKRFPSRAWGSFSSRIFSASSFAGPPGMVYGAAISSSSVSFSRDLPVTPCCCSVVTVCWMSSSLTLPSFSTASAQLRTSSSPKASTSWRLLASQSCQHPPTTEPGVCEPPASGSLSWHDCNRPNSQQLIGASCCGLARKATPPRQGCQFVTSRAGNPSKNNYSNTEICTCALRESWRQHTKHNHDAKNLASFQPGRLGEISL